MEEEIKDKMSEKGHMIDKVLTENAAMILVPVKEIVGRELTDEERDRIITSAKAFHMITMIMMKAVL